MEAIERVVQQMRNEEDRKARAELGLALRKCFGKKDVSLNESILKFLLPEQYERIDQILSDMDANVNEFLTQRAYHDLNKSQMIEVKREWEDDYEQKLN